MHTALSVAHIEWQCMVMALLARVVGNISASCTPTQACLCVATPFHAQTSVSQLEDEPAILHSYAYIHASR